MKNLLADLGEWIEEKLIVLASVVTYGMYAWWAWEVGRKVFNQVPVTYGLNLSAARESVPVLLLLGLQLAAVVVSAVVSAVLRTDYRSFFCEYMSLKVAGVGAVALACWWAIGPNPHASFGLLLSLIVVSSVLGYLHNYGPLRWSPRQKQPIRVGESVSASHSDVHTAQVSRPKTTFASICGNAEIKARLKAAAQAITASLGAGARPRNGILLHGEPGNGKTGFAEALAGELGLPLIQFSHAEVASQWVGERTSRIRQAFEQAKRAQPCVLFIDEVDSFLEARNDRNDGVKEDRDVTNALLTLMVDIRKHRVILMAATNHLDALDGAAVREGRFDYKVEITPPDAEARLGLLEKGLRDNLPGVQIDKEVTKAVAGRWNGFSAKRILAVTEELPAFLKGQGGRSRIGYEDFMGALRQLQGQRGAKPENVKPLSELLLAPEAREALDLITGRMADPEHTEKYGGTLPTGVLFSGPPGTGKTATAKALAAEIGWAFLPTTGAELARDPKKLESINAKAKDLRPAIIFIDEADELLRSREFSGSTDATNKLLTLMDGVGDRVRDVVWIAATNHPESIDAALLRGGRFTEKVRFELPDDSVIATVVSRWIASRKLQLGAGLTPARVAHMLGQQSIANAEAALQAALNRAVARRTTPVTVSEADVVQGVRSVCSD